jgi:hypothetical protein
MMISRSARWSALTILAVALLGPSAQAGLFRRQVVVVPSPTYVVTPAPVTYVTPAPVVRTVVPTTVYETPAVYVPSTTIVERPASYVVPAPVIVRPARVRYVVPRTFYVYP